MASEVCRMIHHLHLNDHSIGASVEEKGDASKGVRGGTKGDGDSFISGEPAMTADDVSDEDSDSDSHLFDDKPVATEEDTTQDSDADYGYYRCVGCTEPDSTWNQTVQLSPFFDYPSDEEPIGVTMEEIDAMFDRGEVTDEHIDEVLASIRSRQLDSLI